MNDVSMIKAVIFDLDNTIYDYDTPNQYAEKSVASWLKKHKDMEMIQFQELYHRSKLYVKEYTSSQGASHNRMLYFQRFCELAGWKPTDCALELYKQYWSSYLHNMKINPEVPDLLSFLRANGIRIGICTDLTVYIQQKKIRKLGIDSYIDCLVTSEEAGIEKNDTRIFQLILKKLACASGEAIMIGDDFVKDYLGARRVGINAFWYCSEACESDWKKYIGKLQLKTLENEAEIRNKKVKSMGEFKRKLMDILKKRDLCYGVYST